MLYLVPLTKVAPSTLYVKTMHPQCLQDLAATLRHEKTRYRVSLCLFHTHMSQEESYTRYLDWILQASRSSDESFFFGVPFEDYEKWVQRLVGEDDEDESGVVLSVEPSTDPSACFSTGPSSFVVCTELFFRHP